MTEVIKGGSIKTNTKLKLPTLSKRVEFKLENNSGRRRSSCKDYTKASSDCSESPSKFNNDKRKFSAIQMNIKTKSRQNTVYIDDGIRRDAYGNEIKKGSKTHKLSFLDKVTRNNLVEYINIQEIRKGYRVDDENCQCHCSIF